MKKATLNKVKKAQDNARAVTSGIGRITETNFYADKSKVALTKIFGKSAVKKMERAESISCAVFVVAGMLPKGDDSNERRFLYLQEQLNAKDDVRKWSLTTIFPSLTSNQRKEVKRELEDIGFVMKRGKIVAFCQPKP